VAGDLPRTPLGELTALFGPSSWITGRGGRGWDKTIGWGRRDGKERVREGK